MNESLNTGDTSMPAAYGIASPRRRVSDLLANHLNRFRVGAPPHSRLAAVRDSCSVGPRSAGPQSRGKTGARGAEAALAFVVACSVGLTAACGRTEADQIQASDSSVVEGLDVCSLLTPEDIQEVTGVVPGVGEPGINDCTWPAADGSNVGLVSLLVAKSLTRSFEDLKREYRENLDADAEEILHQIDGVGRFAVAFNDSPMVQIFSDWGFVQVLTIKHEEKHALELAKRAYARLPE